MPANLRTAVLALAVVAMPVEAALGDCAADAKTALDARLTALPLRETIDSLRDGEHERVLLEIETLKRIHSVIKSVGGSADAGVDLLILDGKGWSKEHGHWQPFAAAAATAESTVEDEQGLATQLTDGAAVTCLGPVTVDGRQFTGYDLKLDADPSSSAPYTSMQLYVDPTTGLPHNLDMKGQGEAGPAVTNERFEYPRNFKLTAPR